MQCRRGPRFLVGEAACRGTVSERSSPGPQTGSDGPASFRQSQVNFNDVQSINKTIASSISRLQAGAEVVVVITNMMGLAE